MAATRLVKVGSTIYPEITALIPNREKIVDFERGSDGNAHGDLIANKWKLQITFGVLTAEQTSAILNSIVDFSFTVEFYDPMTGASGTFVGYEGNKNFPLLCEDINGGYMTNGGTLNLIEL